MYLYLKFGMQNDILFFEMQTFYTASQVFVTLLSENKNNYSLNPLKYTKLNKKSLR